MKEQKVDLWDIPDAEGVKCITTCGVVGSKGELVMGRGVALQAKIRYPELPKILGILVSFSNEGNVPYYIDKYNIISFPTKWHWKHNSDLELIKHSSKKLEEIIESNKLERVFLPRPGCMNGGLDWEKQVKPIISSLPDLVTVIWKN